MKRIISVTTGTRADYGLLRPLLHLISKSTKLELKLIVAGMHLSKKHGMTINEIKKDGFKINGLVKMIPLHNYPFDMSIALGNGIIGFSRIFKKIKPDINLVLGDRDEALASSLAASHMNIVNAHIHGGERTHGIDEYNRHAITKISNIHFAVTKNSKERILKLGENPKFVKFTGSPSIDEIRLGNFKNKQFLEKKYDLNLNEINFLLVYHPVTTEFQKSKSQIKNILEELIVFKRKILAIAPNSDAGNKEIFNNLKLFSKNYPFLKIFPNIPRTDYLGLLKNQIILVGNSSSGIIEASYFGTPVINIGMRQDGREKSDNVIDCKNSKINIKNSINHAIKLKNKTYVNTKIYGNGHASEKILQTLENIKLDEKIIQKQIHY